MIPAWTLLLALLVGAAAGWFARDWLSSRRGARTAATASPAAEPEPTEPALKMEAVLTELERRYQGRKAEPEPKPRRSRKTSA